MTGIEWTEYTWNPMVGCSLMSAGCVNCYAMRQAYRLEHAFKAPSYQGTTKLSKSGAPTWSGQINRATDKTMRKPLTMKEPAVFFVNSMSDFFHPFAPLEVREEAWSIMLSCPRHTFQVLTKRPDEARRWLADREIPDHIWIGASTENQATLEKRMPDLMAIKARVRFISAEPLLGPLDLAPWLRAGLAWVITGGESGPGARPMKAQWVREIDGQCRAYAAPHFFKQWGIWENNPLKAEGKPESSDPYGKGGGLLDGDLIREFPAGAKLRRADPATLEV